MFISHNQAQLYTVAFGSSERAILAIGGWTGSWELWTDPFSFLSESWRTVAFDHRGTGATVAPADTINWANMVSDVFAIMDYWNIQECVLAAESAGAATAIQAALKDPTRITGLVLVDALYYNPPSQQPDLFLAGLQQYYAETITQFVNTCVPEPNSEAIRRWGEHILGRASQEAAIQLYQCNSGLDLRPQLSRITQPTLILHGEQDNLVPVEATEHLASEIPNSHLHIFPETGHVPTVTRPKEVADAINQFFA